MKRIDFTIEKPDDLVQVVSRLMTEINNYSQILDITFNWKRQFVVVRCRTISFSFKVINNGTNVRMETNVKDINSLLNYMAGVWVMVTDTSCKVEEVSEINQ